MNTTVRRREDRVAWVLDVTDGEVRPQPYSRAGRRYRVDSVAVEFVRTTRDGDGDEPGEDVNIRLHGTVLKADGTDSRNRCDETFWRHETLPDWLADLVARLRVEVGP